MSDTIEQLALKLSILKQGVEASLTKIKIHEFKMATRDCIALGHRHVNKFNDNEYHNEYNQIAFNILSCSPFNTQVHVCGALRCTQDTFMEWHSIHENFREAVKHGFVNGEMLARELLVEFSFEPSNKV
ncbi:MAG: hypothetical protein GY834_03465, partial [Bacteroidetes bacterium]|nr:hypothetical protein [Bacteroidota bacterium]